MDENLFSLYQKKTYVSFERLSRDYSVEALENGIISIYNLDKPYDHHSRRFLRKLLYAYAFISKEIPNFSSETQLDLCNLFQSVNTEACPELAYLKKYLISNGKMVPNAYNPDVDMQEYYGEYILLQPEYKTLVMSMLESIYLKPYDPISGVSIDLFLHLKRDALTDLIVTFALTDYDRFQTLIPLLDIFFLSQQFERFSWVFVLRKLIIKNFSETASLCKLLAQYDDIPYAQYLSNLYQACDCNRLPINTKISLYAIYLEQILIDPKSKSSALLDIFRIAIPYQDFDSLEKFLECCDKSKHDRKELFDQLRIALHTESDTNDANHFINQLLSLLSQQKLPPEMPYLLEFIRYLVSFIYLHPAMPFFYDYHRSLKQYFMIHTQISADYIPFESLFNGTHNILTKSKSKVFNFFSDNSCKEISFETANALDWRLTYEITKKTFEKSLPFSPEKSFSTFITDHIQQFGFPYDDFWKKLILGLFPLDNNALVDVSYCFKPALQFPLVKDWFGLAIDLYIEHGSDSLETFLKKVSALLCIKIQNEQLEPMNNRHITAWLLDLQDRLQQLTLTIVKKIRSVEHRVRIKQLYNLLFTDMNFDLHLAFHRHESYEAKLKTVIENEQMLLNELNESEADITVKKKKKNKSSKKKLKPSPEKTSLTETSLSHTSDNQAILHQYVAKPKASLKPNHNNAKDNAMAPCVYPKEYLSLATLLYIVKKATLPIEHPYTKIAKLLESGLQEALVSFKAHDASIDALEHTIQSHSLPEYDLNTVEWFIALEALLKKLSATENHARLKSILTPRDKLLLPAPIKILPENTKNIIKNIWKLFQDFYQDNSEYLVFSLFGSTARAWVEQSLKLPILSEPNDLDFSLHGPVEHWQFDKWITYFNHEPKFTITKIKNPSREAYAHISLIYNKQIIDLNFNIQEPPVLGSFSARVILPLSALPVPLFSIEKDALTHFQRRKIVINKKDFDYFLILDYLPFLLKELCLRLHEGWKLSQQTADYLASKTTQDVFSSPYTDRAICIFLTQYLSKNSSAFLHYFSEAPASYNILFIWMHAFGVSQSHQDNLKEGILNTRWDSRLSAMEKNINILNQTLALIASAAYQSYDLEKNIRAGKIIDNLSRNLGTLNFNTFYPEESNIKNGISF